MFVGHVNVNCDIDGTRFGVKKPSNWITMESSPQNKRWNASNILFEEGRIKGWPYQCLESTDKDSWSGMLRGVFEQILGDCAQILDDQPIHGSFVNG